MLKYRKIVNIILKDKGCVIIVKIGICEDNVDQLLTNEFLVEDILDEYV